MEDDDDVIGFIARDPNYSYFVFIVSQYYAYSKQPRINMNIKGRDIFVPSNDIFVKFAAKCVKSLKTLLGLSIMRTIADIHLNQNKRLERLYKNGRLISIDKVPILDSIKYQQGIIYYIDGLLLTPELSNEFTVLCSDKKQEKPSYFTNEDHSYDLVPHNNLLKLILNGDIKGKDLISACLSNSNVNKICNSNDQKFFKDRLWKEFYINFTKNNYDYPNPRSLYIQMYTLYAVTYIYGSNDINNGKTFIFVNDNGTPPQIPYGKYKLYLPKYEDRPINDFYIGKLHIKNPGVFPFEI